MGITIYVRVGGGLRRGSIGSRDPRLDSARRHRALEALEPKKRSGAEAPLLLL